MLQFILGRAGSGKSQWILDQLDSLTSCHATTQPTKIYLIVPEQFTFNAEQKIYRQLGATKLKDVKVLSFTRIIHHIFKEFGGGGGHYADDLTKLILMNQTLRETGDLLTTYQKASKNVLFAQQMLDMVTEFKHAQMIPAQIEKLFATHQIPLQEQLQHKTKDFMTVYQHYEAMLSEQYQDSLDDVSKVVEIIKKHKYFSDSVVFFDEFKSFTPSELLLIRWMIVQVRQLTVALCTDPFIDQPYNLFFVCNQTMKQLKQLARKQCVPIRPSIIKEQPLRFKQQAMIHMEKNAFRLSPDPFEAVQTSIKTIISKHPYEEIEYTAATIRHLVMKFGYRYRDVVVVSRQMTSYEHIVQAVFEQYDIPFYLDTVKSIAHMPLVRFICLSFDCVLEKYPSDRVISLLKCGLCGISTSEISQLENYLYLWDITGIQWKQPFTMSIFGARSAENEQEELEQELLLLEYNKIRHHLMKAFEVFEKEIQEATAYHIAQSVMTLLETLGVKTQLEQIITELQEQTDDAASVAQASTYQRVWEICEELLQKITFSIGNKLIAPQQWKQLFWLLCEEYDMGTLPQTLDCVMVGRVERIRADTPKALFVVGASDGIFPYIPTHSTLLTNQERQQLIEIGIVLGGTLQQRLLEEKFMAYKSITMSSERLYMTTSQLDFQGKEQLPSSLFLQFDVMFGKTVRTKTSSMNPLYFCCSEKTAFWTLATRYREDSDFTASLRNYFSVHPEYTAILSQLEQTIEQNTFRLYDLNQTKKFYGQVMSMSPSRIEDFHRCKFLYFCKHGMRIFPRQKVSLRATSRGSILHTALYDICKEMIDFTTFDELKLKEMIKQFLDNYLEKSLGGSQHKTTRFLYLYRRLEKTLLKILKHLFDELSQSKFRPIHYEYRIGDEGNIKPFMLTSKNGIQLYLHGQVDRIDLYINPKGEQYIRVVDYKSGQKNFSLTDIFNGINLQMLLYLLCFEKDTSGLYKGIKGAGILYLPISEPDLDLDHTADQSHIEEITQKHYCMSGIILDDEEVLKAMEMNLRGKYIPVQLKTTAYQQQGSLTPNVFIERHLNPALCHKKTFDSLVSYEQMGMLFTHVEQLIQQMADELVAGFIEAKPLKQDKQGGLNPCLYCDYFECCRFEQQEEPNQYQTLNIQELFKKIHTT